MEPIAALPTPSVARLRAVMARLRDADNGCPWDLEQSLDSLKSYLIEESHELVDAIDDLGAAARRTAAPADAAPQAIESHREELGDVLLQVVFQSQLAAEFGWFSLDDVAAGIADKMIRRHPHVFQEPGDSASGEALSSDQVVDQWQAIKAKEKSERTDPLDGVSRSAPALVRAEQIGAKAAKRGFDWPDVSGALDKVDEERLELEEALQNGDPLAIEHELGDLLFAVTSVARHAGVNPELALSGALRRFRARFAPVARKLADQPDADLETMERWWQEAKTLSGGDRG